MTVKGLYNTIPEEWDPEVPFCDPNNAKLLTPDGKTSKPRKGILFKMFKFIVQKYNVRLL